MKTAFRFILNTIPRPWLIRASYLVQPLLAWYLKGDKLEDPIDGKSYRSFLPYGYGKSRENVLAPGTLSLERHRLLWLYLRDYTSLFTKPHALLHVAPEQAFLGRFKSMSHLAYTTTDLESPIADVRADLCDLPFETNTFDVILCNHVLEHIPDDRKAMEELYRVLKPGGWGVFQVPLDRNRTTTFEDNSITNKEERARIFGQYDHVRVYGLDYHLRLQEVGFQTEEIHIQRDLNAVMVKRYALDPEERIPLVRKPL